MEKVINTGSTLVLWLVAGLLISAPEVVSQSNAPLSITYVGNMGVVIASADDAVIIDGLHKEYRSEYVYPSVNTARQLIQGKYRDLPSIDAVLVTHHHRDHFDASYLREFLRYNAESFVVGPPQVIDLISSQTNAVDVPSLERAHRVDLTLNVDTVYKESFGITSFNCVHVNAARHHAVQNVGYLVHMGGHKLVHIGDAHWDVSSAQFEQAQLVEASIDIAIMPFWMLLEKDASDKIIKYINPRRIVATHIPPSLDKGMAETLVRNFPQVILFDDPEEVYELK